VTGGDGDQMTDSRQYPGGTVTLTVPSHPKYLYVVRSALYPLILEAGFSKREARKVVLAVDEACSNIIRYAYAGDHAKTITMTVEDDAERFVVRLRDYGRKAGRAEIAPRDLKDIRPGGLGTHFIKLAFETVMYDTDQGPGTLLTLEKKKQQVKP
jgi:anti-sigma regulatory factor (Ser/Thr protein kinase)